MKQRKSHSEEMAPADWLDSPTATMPDTAVNGGGRSQKSSPVKTEAISIRMLTVDEKIYSENQKVPQEYDEEFEDDPKMGTAEDADDTTPESISTLDDNEEKTLADLSLTAQPFVPTEASRITKPTVCVEEDILSESSTEDAESSVPPEIVTNGTNGALHSLDSISEHTEELAETTHSAGSASGVTDGHADGLQPAEKDVADDKFFKTIHFHRDGDLFVKVQDEQGNFILYDVLSACLAAASPVWRRIIYGTNHTRGADGHFVLEMLNDDHGALHLLFRLVHYHYYDMPQRPSVDQLYNLCVVADKYQCTRLFAPYVREWIVDLNWHVTMANDRNDDDKTMWVAWIFGDPKCFGKMLNKVCQKATVGPDGALLNCAGRPWSDSALPQVIVDVIAKARARGIRDILKALDTRVTRLLTGKGPGAVFCRAQQPDEQQQCMMTILGSTIASLTECGLWAVPQANKYKGSIAALAHTLLTLKVLHFTLPGVRPHLDSHGPCGLGHQEEVIKVLGRHVNLPRLVSTRLAQQAVESGAFDLEKFKTFMDDETLASLSHELCVQVKLEEDTVRLDEE